MGTTGGHGNSLRAQGYGGSGPLAASRIFFSTFRDCSLRTQMSELVENRCAIRKVFRPTLCKVCSLWPDEALQTRRPIGIDGDLAPSLVGTGKNFAAQIVE